MKLFGKTLTTALAFGTAMMALVGKETVSADEATAANEELAGHNITGVQFITQAAYEQLEASSTALETAQSQIKATTDALAAAGVDSVAALVTQRDDYKTKADEYGAKSGDTHTTVTLKDGKSDVEEPAGVNAHQKVVDDLHAKMLG